MYPQVLVNVKVPRGFRWEKYQEIQTAQADAERSLNGRGRVLLAGDGAHVVELVERCGGPPGEVGVEARLDERPRGIGAGIGRIHGGRAKGQVLVAPRSRARSAVASAADGLSTVSDPSSALAVEAATRAGGPISRRIEMPTARGT